MIAATGTKLAAQQDVCADFAAAVLELEEINERMSLVQQCAQQGHASAQTLLGFMYAAGRGVRQDDAEAAAWFRRAADQGVADAQFNLGLAHESGRGVPQNDVTAHMC